MKRIYFADILKIAACFAVVLLHASGQGFSASPVTGSDWLAYNFYDSLTRSAVPLFVMISGIFFLSPDWEIPFRKLMGKHVFRLICAFFFWSFVFALYELIINGSGESFLSLLLHGHYHLWYLPMLTGLYLLTPILKKIYADRKIALYYLVLGFIFGIAAFFVRGIHRFSDLSDFLQLFRLTDFFGYTVYFMAGRWLYDHPPLAGMRRLLIALGSFSFLATLFGTVWLSRASGFADNRLFSYFAPNIFFMTVALFLLFEPRREAPTRHKGNLVAKLASLTFGVYLIHPFFLDLFGKILHGIPPVLTPLTALFAFAVSLVVSFALNFIPHAKKFIL